MKSKDEENELISSLPSTDQERLFSGKLVKLPEDYAEKFWHPKLFLLNITRDHDEEIRYSAIQCNRNIEIREYHDVYGNFFTKFDLHHFPHDIQLLNVSIISALFDKKVILQSNPKRLSGINHEAFVDQQEWNLYKHVEAHTSFMRGYLFQNDDDYDDDDDGDNDDNDDERKEELDAPGHARERSVLTIRCYAGQL